MKNRTRTGTRFLSIVLAVMMVVGMLPATALAAEGEPVVAQIGETSYATLQAAINAAQSGDTVTLLDDTAAASSIVVDKQVTLDLNGHALSGDVKVDSTGKLTVKDSSEAGDGEIYGTVTVLNTLNLESGTITFDGSTPAVQLTSSDAKNGTVATLNVTGGTIAYTGDLGAAVMGTSFSIENSGTADGTYGVKMTFSEEANVTSSSYSILVGEPVSCHQIAISGGSFSYGESAALLAEVYAEEIKDVDIDGYIMEGSTVTINGVPYTKSADSAETTGVAKIGETQYETLADAVAAGGNITLLRDVTLTDTLAVPADATVTLNLNGKTISQIKECTASYEMIANNGSLTITGNGKISFTDTGAGDPTHGWGAYTIRNNGTLVVENGTIENLSAQNQAGKAFAHTTLAIFQYSGSTTINGGTISTPNYRSLRLWSGDVTINGGVLDGQVWVHCVNDTAKLTINDGEFSPNGNDGSSVFVNNSGYKAELNVTGGTFATKIGADAPTELNGAKITGGTFTAAAKASTNTALLGEGMAFIENDDGTYTVNKPAAEATGPNVTVGDNVTVDDSFKTSVSDALSSANAAVEVGLNVSITAAATDTVTYDIAPNGSYTVPEGGLEMKLPVVGVDDEGAAYVVHEHKGKKYIYVGTVASGCITFTNTVGFSTFTVNAGGLADAVAAAQTGDTIVLGNGEYELPTFSGKELTFKGESKEGVIVNDAPDARTQGWNGSTFHFENLTAKGATGASDVANYHGLANGVVAVTYKDCNVNNLRFLYAHDVSFEGCAFNSGAQEHSFWTYGASNVTVTNCTFTYTDRAVNCYSESGADHETTIAFTDCSFTYAGTADTPEGAVEINSGSVKSIELTMDGCIAPEKGAMWFNSQWDSKQGENTVVTVDGEIVWHVADVAQVGEGESAVKYKSLQEAIDAAQSGNTVTLLSDVALSTYVKIDKSITLDLAEHTVSRASGTGLYIKNAEAEVIIENGSVEAGGEAIYVGTAKKVDIYDVNAKSTGKAPAVYMQTSGVVNIYGGTFETVQKHDGAYFTLNIYDSNRANCTINVYGGTFVNFNPANNTAEGTNTNFCPEGYAALPDLNGNYVVGKEPTATVNNLGMTTVAAGDYMVYGNGDNTADMPLSFVMQFLADQGEEDMADSPFAEWYGDFVITFTGIKEGSFTADGCYLAGHYGSFGWVKVPVDDMTIEEGVRYPVMLGVNMGQKYDYICSSVQDFKCALYLTPEILEANPNLQVKLELGVVDNSKGSDAAANALINNESVYSVTDYTYDAEDFVVKNYVAFIDTNENGEMDADETGYETLKEALVAANAAGAGVANYKVTIDLLDSEYVYAAPLTSDADMVTITNPGTYTITGGAGILANYEIEVNPDKVDGEFVLNIKDAHLTLTKLTLRKNATLNVTNSRVDYNVFLGGSSYLSAYINSNLNVTDSTIGFDPSRAGVDNPEDYTFKGGNQDSFGPRLVIYGNANIESSKLYVYVGQAEQSAFDVTGNANVTMKDSWVSCALINVGNGFNPKYLTGDGNAVVDGTTLSATLTLDNTTVQNSQYRGDYTTNNGIQVGNGTTKGTLVIKNGSVVDFTKRTYGDDREIGLNVTATGTVTIADSTVKMPKAANAGTILVSGTSTIAANTVTGSGWVYMNGVTLDADTKLIGAKVGFINGTNTIVGSTIKDGWFSVGIGQNDAATAAAAFAEANGIDLGDVTVNVSGDAVIGNGSDDAYTGWIGSAYSAEKTQYKYVLNVENSLATFGYLHVSKDGELNVTGHATNKYTYDNANVDFYAGDFIINGTATFDGTDAWVKTTKLSVDHADGVLNIVNGTHYEASRHNGATTGDTLVFWSDKAGTVNVNNATVEIDNVTTINANSALNIGGKVTAKGAVTNNGTITLTDAAATLTAAEGLTVASGVDGYVAIYKDGAYKLIVPVAKIGETYYATLAEAVAACESGETVQLVADIELTESIRVESGKTVVVDLNGKKLTGPDVPATSSYYAFIVDGGDLTLKDSVGNGELWAKCYGVETKSGFFTMESGKITATNNGTFGSAVVNYGGNVTIKGGTLDAAVNAVYTGGYFSDASTTITDVTITAGVVNVEDWPEKDFTETVTSTSNTYEPVDGYKWVQDAESDLYVLTAKTYVAQIGDTEYETVAEALAAATSGQTVVLTADATGTMVMVPAGVTLDLNGKVLTANYVFSAGDIYDTTKGAGKLTVAANNAAINSGNTLMPLYDGNSYRFTTVVTSVDLSESNGTLKYQFFFRLGTKDTAERTEFTNILIDALATSQIELYAHVNWTGVLGPIGQDYVVGSEFVTGMQNVGRTVALNFVGYENLGDLTFTMSVACKGAMFTVEQTFGERIHISTNE